MIDRFLLTLTVTHEDRDKPADTLRYELVPGERTVIGNHPREAHCSIAHAGLTSQHADIQFRDGSFVIQDLKSALGTSVDGQRLTTSRVPVAIGQVIETARARAVISRFDAPLLDDVWVAGDLLPESWICFGRRRDCDHGRWPAFRRKRGVVERALVTGFEWLSPKFYAGSRWKARRFSTYDYDYVVTQAADGIPMRLFAAALRDAPADLRALCAQVYALREVDAATEATNLVVTWHGDVMYLPVRGAFPPYGDGIWTSDAGETPVLPNGRGIPREEANNLPRERIAELARALFPEAWRAELDLREQLASLDEEGVRWLLERSASASANANANAKQRGP